MKKLFITLVLVVVLALSITVFAACNQEDQTGDDAGTNPPADTVTVSWYQGSKLLKEETITKGAKVQSWTPTADGKTFTGWYAEASLTQAFDFNTVINADTDIFAAFKSDEFVEDELSYYLIGTGAGDMGLSGWDHAASDANLTMTKQDVSNANIYEITIDMYAGDMFQICHDGSWDGQVGIGWVEGAEYCDGVNFYDNGTYTAEDKKVAQVKIDDEVVFIGSDEYNKGFETWNIKLAEGKDGTYKITYTTYPNAGAYNKVTIELVEALEPMTVTHNMYFIGTMNNWSETYEDDTLRLNESDDKATWTGTIEITEAMYADWTADANGGVACAALKIYNAIDDQYYGINNENILLSAGTYNFKYTVATNTVEFAECAYYVVGTFLDGTTAVNFAVKAGVTPALTVSGNVATGTVEAVDVTSESSYSWIADQGKPGVMAIKVVYGSELGISVWYSDETNGGDNWYLQAGTYTISLDIESGVVTVTAA